MEFQILENKLTPEDFIRLKVATGFRDRPIRQVEKALDNDLLDVVAVINDEIVGMGRLVGDGMYFTIVDVVVRPEYQGKGVGSAIIKSMLDYIGNSTYEGSRVSVQLISEVGKEEFYIKQGFKLIPHEFCGPALRKIIYKD